MVNERRIPSNRRAGQRGAAVFVVVLVIAMLTAIGMFAASAATLSVTASGHGRQATQTHYLTEYAATVVLAELERYKSTDTIEKARDMAAVAGTEPRCSVTSNACWTYRVPAFENRTVAQPLVEPRVAGSPAVPGGLGQGDLDWDAWVEVTDMYVAAGVPGYDESSSTGNAIQQCRLAVSAAGFIWPRTMGPKALAIEASGNVEVLSASIKMPCPKR